MNACSKHGYNQKIKQQYQKSASASQAERRPRQRP